MSTGERLGGGTAVPGVKPCGREGAELAATLAGRTRSEVRFLSDRLIPKAGLKADLIAVSPAAVWVIEAGDHEGEIHVSGRGPGQRLRVGKTELTDHVEGLTRRVGLVAAAVEAIAPGLGTFGAFCFPRAELSGPRTPAIAGLPICSVEGLAKRLNVRGPADQVAAVRAARDLGLHFPAC